MSQSSGNSAENPSMPGTPAGWLDLTSAAPPAQAPELEATYVEADSVSILKDLKLDLTVRSAGILGKLDHYDVQAVIGQGGMGIVFRAYDQTLKRTVAIKVLNPRLSSSERFRRRFLQEARSAAAINHPNVVTIHAVGEHLGHPFLVMEFVEGLSLRRRIDQQPRMGFRDILRISAQIADGLSAAHARGVIHRDIKPMNILLENGVERVKIADFGLARAALENSDLTSLGSVVGTPAYMAPEQVSGGKVDSRTDLFSLGCVMYAMGTGHSPFHGTDVMNIVGNLVHAEPRPLCEVNAGIPKALSDLVDRLLQKNADNRFQTAVEVARLLTQMLAATVDRPTDEIRLVVPAAFKSRRLSRVQIGAAALLACLLGWLLLGRPGWPPASPSAAPGAQAGNLGSVSNEQAVELKRAAAVEQRLLTVSAASEAHFSRLDEAIDSVKYPGTRVQILDSQTYSGSILIDESERLSGLVIEAVEGAQPKLIATRGSNAPVVTIRDTSDVVLRRLSIEAADQAGVEIRGKSPGLVLEELNLKQRGAAPFALVNVAAGAAGTSDRPIVIFRCRAECNVGQCVWIKGTAANPVLHVHAIENRFTSRADGSLAVLWGTLADVKLHRNLFWAGGIGVNLNFSPPDRASRAALTNNTFFRTPYWLGFVSTQPEQAEGILVANNLIVETPAMEAGVRPLADFSGHPGWMFEHNVWEAVPGATAATVGPFATLVEKAPLASRDAASEEFLRPAADSLLATLGKGGELPPYVGAQPPAPATSP